MDREPVSMGLDLKMGLNAVPGLSNVGPPPSSSPTPPSPSPSPTPKDPTMLTRLRNEPVAFVGTLQTLWLALLTLANVFEWWSWSDAQTAAVTGVWTALTALVTWLVRGSVSPVPSSSDTQGQHLPAP